MALSCRAQLRARRASSRETRSAVPPRSPGQFPAADALVALMCLHAARFDARVDRMGGLLLLEEQDRSLWDGELVQRGLDHLTRSARGGTLSRYHAEAGIAAEHCLAPSYAETNW